MPNFRFGVLFFLCFQAPLATGQPFQSTDVFDNCIAAIRRDPTSATLVPPLAFCGCLGDYVLKSADEKRAAINRAGTYCLNMMKGIDSLAKGYSRAAFDTCIQDQNVLTAFPATYQAVCRCFSQQMAKNMIDHRALESTGDADYITVFRLKRRVALDSCAYAN